MALFVPFNNEGTKSTLIVTKATDSDSGNYSCSPSSGHSTSVMVHVVDGQCFYYILYHNKTSRTAHWWELVSQLNTQHLLITSHNDQTADRPPAADWLSQLFFLLDTNKLDCMNISWLWIQLWFDLRPRHQSRSDRTKSVANVYVYTFLIFLSDGEALKFSLSDISLIRAVIEGYHHSYFFQEKIREQVNVVCQVKEQKCGVKAKYFLSYFHCFAASSRLEQKIALMANKSNFTLNMNWIFMVLRIGSK